MKFGIIRERKSPPDRRVVLSPEACQKVLSSYKDAEIVVEPSPIRTYSEADYKAAGIPVDTNMEQCDVLLGVKEVPIDALIRDKKYFFFSHTIKKQPYNRELLQAILEKNIELYDHEVITNAEGQRLVAFGRYAGIVGAYNGFRAFGLKFGLFNLPKAEVLPDQAALIAELRNIDMPVCKILLTGKGRVGNGAKEMLDGAGIDEVSVDEYLNKAPGRPVYCQIDVLDYNKRSYGKSGDLRNGDSQDGDSQGSVSRDSDSQGGDLKNGDGPQKDNAGRNGHDTQDFFENPAAYESDFFRFAKVTDFFIAGHFYGQGAPYLFTREDAKHRDFKIKVVADVSCDIDGPVASTIRPSTIAEPIYGYDPETEQET
ncbi:MAG: NAD(P)-dependent oxidoreductase, partial [Pricia sp.]